MNGAKYKGILAEPWFEAAENLGSIYLISISTMSYVSEKLLEIYTPQKNLQLGLQQDKFLQSIDYGRLNTNGPHYFQL